MVQIRIATPIDAKDILSIYAPYIINTSYTFETEVPTEFMFSQRIRNYLEMRPWLGCVIQGKLAGYAYASSYRERTGYQWCAESSVYIHDEFHGRKIGFHLYKVLLEILQMQGYRNIYAVINLPNEPSVKLHEKCGFKWFATYEKVGYKLGRWKNVGWWKLSMNSYNEEPAPPTKFSQMDHREILAIIESASEKI
jgi:phosphinothricin acetyltransferase